MCKTRTKQIETIVENAVNVDELEAMGNAGEKWPKPRYVFEVWEQKPNIAVRLWKHGSFAPEQLGFAKVNWPDSYDRQFGLNVALGKAAALLLKEG